MNSDEIVKNKDMRNLLLGNYIKIKWEDSLNWSEK